MSDGASMAETTDVPAGEGPLKGEPEDGAMPVEVIRYIGYP